LRESAALIVIVFSVLSYSLEQNSAAQQPSGNSTATNYKPLNTNTTSNITSVTAAGNSSVAEIKGSDRSASVAGNGTAEQDLVDQLADRFQFVYSARESFAIQNLSASEMFQVYSSAGVLKHPMERKNGLKEGLEREGARLKTTKVSLCSSLILSTPWFIVFSVNVCTVHSGLQVCT